MNFVTENELPQLLESRLPVLLKFHADWCPPCRRIAPALDQLAQDLDGRAIIATIDADHNPGLTAKMGVNALPTFIVFHNGLETERMIGIRSREKILGALRLANITVTELSQT